MTVAILAAIALICITAWAIRNAAATHRTLTNLRANCFIPDERGVKRRYADCSVARRVKAETE